MEVTDKPDLTPGTLHGLLAKPIDLVGLQPRDPDYLDETYLRRDRCSLCWLLFNATHVDEEPSDSSVVRNHPKASQLIGYDGLASEGKRIRCSVEWLLNGHLLGAPEPGKKLPPPTRRLPPRLIRRWLGICKTHHGSGCRPLKPPHGIFKLLEGLKFVDLVDEAVIFSSLSGSPVTEYATLSYVWGSIHQLTLSSLTLADISSKGSLRLDRPGLPKTVRDAMILVKSLGFRFIWADARARGNQDRRRPDREHSLEQQGLDLPGENALQEIHDKNPVRLYLECVELFSGRLLACQTNRLPAFEGMSAVLCPPLRASLFYGLPDSYLDFALLLGEEDVRIEGQRRQRPTPVPDLDMKRLARHFRVAPSHDFRHLAQPPRVARVSHGREVAEWHLRYALLIVWDDDRAVARRDGLALPPRF
ncbi:hypothetical protein LY76DRAFT_680324 [Colletotrichum caudatum]|nr:hypothetical protein LY76DRAFT_680324 [Colletotrichum caudatum]